MRIPTILLACLTLASIASAAPAEPDRHVLVVVWDGMRPDFITSTTTPNLWALTQRGVFFACHHPVYLSATEVNGTAIATGAYPAHDFVLANTDYRPAIDPVNKVEIQNPAVIRKGDEVSDGHYLGRPTVAEILHDRGIRTVIAGSKQVALLHDRARRSFAPDVSPVVYEGEALPPKLEADLQASAGAFPPVAADQNKFGRDAWTTHVLIDVLWREGVPAYSLLWLAEPDASQHATGPGSEQSLRAIRSSDENLGRVVADLRRRNLLDATDIFVVSDHGFSTIGRKADVAADLTASGLPVLRQSEGSLQPGQVIAVSNGGSTLFYVGHHDAATCRRLVALLHTKDWAGVVFARERIDGTFPLSAAHVDAPEAPDVIVSLHWSDAKSANGTPGLQTSDLPANSDKIGNHASLSPYDMHNALVAAGPDFRVGVRDTLPSGNTDVAPTILWCLGLHDATAGMDGRVLGEALTIDAPKLESYRLQRLTADTAAADGARWHQYLQVSEVNGVRYLDEGNGQLTEPTGPSSK